MTTEIEKIIERVKKLMAMAGDSASPNEAAIAARRARKLMDDHQISMDDLADRDEFGQPTVGPGRKFTAVWEQTIAISVAKLNDCQLRFEHADTDMKWNGYWKLQFQGFDSDTEVCKFMFHYITEACKRQCSQYMKDAGFTRYNARVGTDFKLAFSISIRNKINEMLKEREKLTMSDGKSLMVVKKALVEQKFGVAKYVSKGARHLDGDAANSGFEAGRRVNITTGLNGTGNNKRLK